ncbi:MrcB family domain-containing protein [Mucilaginibacter agri]|uniref:DUF3578 domain-containing protein n=1 Tax=Mucilaginibacter agri TaxID=2695265 RepID=A0A965ZG15_9SPHI|nr:DUF3578 domain-containing protein [Mucilaginibacter agri]NCD69417.1 DUF3578 domain-containing protein [Mucilaginibacter agri]
MKELFQYIVNDYQEAYGQDFANHRLGKVLRKTLPEAINEILDITRYKVQGSSGQGVWAACPWIAIFDTLITRSAQSGYYPVFLFKDDMSGFYLSLNQGVTSLDKVYKRDTKDILKIRAQDFRAQIGIDNIKFTEMDIRLRTLKSTTSKYPKLYEAGNIIAKYYPSDNIPEKELLQQDITDILMIYKMLCYNDGISSSKIEVESDEENYTGFENLRNFRFHKRLERNVQLSKKVKKAQGYNCKACGINFENAYGTLGRNFIEAHHLKPISLLTGDQVQLNAKKDFAVLCSNCHSMIHKYQDPSDLDGFRKLLKYNYKHK